MSDAPAADVHATAKANLRDTIKWLATSLAAIGAAFLAGISINGLATLQGNLLFIAILFGCGGLLSILWAISIMLDLLASDVFYFGSLSTGGPIADEINTNSKDLLPPQATTIAELLAFRDSAADTLRTTPSTEQSYEEASEAWDSVNDTIARVTSLAQFLALRNRFRSQRVVLLSLTIAIVLTLGGFALLVGGKSELNVDLSPKIVFNPGAGWSDVATSLAKTCGSDQLRGLLLQKKLFEGWVSIRLTSPGKCSGLEVTVPGPLVQILAPSS